MTVSLRLGVALNRDHNEALEIISAPFKAWMGSEVDPHVEIAGCGPG